MRVRIDRSLPGLLASHRNAARVGARLTNLKIREKPMTTRLHHQLLLILGLTVGLAGCGGGGSPGGFSPMSLALPDAGTPTVTGPVAGTVVPIAPETPTAATPVPTVPQAPPAVSPIPPTAQRLPVTTSVAHPAAERPVSIPETAIPQPLPIAPTPTPPAFVPVKRFARQVPGVRDDPTFTTKAGEYDLGSVIVSTAEQIPSVFLARVHGGIWYPDKPWGTPIAASTRYPVIVFLHGMHDSNVPSYQGYDYLASDLAAHGYVVLSIDANDINGFNNTPVFASGGDFTSQSRGQLVLATLDRLKMINDGRQTTNVLSLQSLAGKIDFDRIGIMGHSRGGQGINDAIQLNDQRVGVTLEQLRSATVNLQIERTSVAPTVWFAAEGAERSTGSKVAFLATLDSLLAALQKQPGFSDADLSAILDNSNITLAAGAATGPNAPPKYAFKAALSLAPTDSLNFQKIANVPFAAMVGSCDGDVFTLDGAHVFDHNRFGRDSSDSAPRFQVVVRGANHNYFNSQWTNDDYLLHGSALDYCYLNSMTQSGIRLTPTDQTAVGSFLVDSFMRYFAGGEVAFAPYWTGTAPLPVSACPNGRSPCDSRVALTVQTNGRANGTNNHKVIAPFNDGYGFNQSYDPATMRLHERGSLDLIDSTAFTNNVYPCLLGSTGLACPGMPSNVFFLLHSSYIPLSYSTYSGGLLSTTTSQLLLRLTRPDLALTISLKEPISGANPPAVYAEDLTTTGYDTLSFRVALIRPAPSKEGPLTAQEVTVVLTDGKGVQSAPIRISDFSDALDSSMGLSIPAGSRAPELLNMVAIPLDAFSPAPETGSLFDPTHLKTLTLNFANTPNDGTNVSLTDVQLQNFGRGSH
jgi:Chlorophyllase enzyme